MTNTNDRDALIDLLWGDDPQTIDDLDIGAGIDRILAAGFTRQPKPHTVETVEELRALDPDMYPAYLECKFGFAYRTTSNKAVHDEVLADRLPATVLTPATQPTASEIAKQAAELLATISAIGLSRIDVTAMEALIEFMRGSVASEPTDAQVEAAAEAVRTSRAFQAAVAFGIPNDHEGHRHASNEFARAALEAAAKVGGDA